jgi:hypothetical protein
VGDRANNNSAGAVFSLTEHWNGARWSLVRNNPGDDSLSGVAAVAKDDVWVLGDSFRHWDGARWKSFPYPNAVELSAIAAVSRNDLWAVGYDPNGAGTPIIARYGCG